MQSISYKLPIGRRIASCRIQKTADPKSAVFAVLNSTATQPYSKEVKTVSGGKKKIYSSKQLKSQLKITANTSDVHCTDVFSKDGTPLKYKILKRVATYHSVLINGAKPDNEDAYFFYTNNKDPIVEYFNIDGTLIFASYDESYHVYIDTINVNLKNIIDIDGKKIIVSTVKDKIVLSVNNPDVYVYPVNGSIFDVAEQKGSAITKHTFFCDRFFHSESRLSNDGSRINFEFDYTKVLPNMVSVEKESVKIVDESFIKLHNKNISAKDIVIYTKTKTINPTDMIGTGAIYQTSGSINVDKLLKLGIISRDEEIFIDYKFVTFIGNNCQIYKNPVMLHGKSVSLIANPTRVETNGAIVDFDSRLDYIIYDRNGFIIGSSSDTIIRKDYSINDGYGFSMYAWSEHGYSGVGITDVSAGEDIPDNSQIIFAKTGYSEGAYSDGPFGGNKLETIDDIQKIMSIQSGMATGHVELAKITFDYTNKNEVVETIRYPKYDPKLLVLNSKTGLIHARMRKQSFKHTTCGITVSDVQVGSYIHLRYVGSKSGKSTFCFKDNVQSDASAFVTNDGHVLSDAVDYNISAVYSYSNIKVYTENGEIPFTGKLIDGYIYIEVNKNYIKESKYIGIGYDDMRPGFWAKIWNNT